MSAEPYSLEREAYSFLTENKFEEAFRLFTKSAEIYQELGNHEQATLCFASAASCWNKKCEEKTFDNAALSYEKAAQEAERFVDYEYASLLYKYAAINHERNAESHGFSNCFYRSKECYRKFLIYSLFSPGKIRRIAKIKEEKGVIGFIKHVFMWFILSCSFAVWGHGERPARSFLAAIAIILLSAFCYTFDYVLVNGIILKPDFFKAIYLSVVTFTTVGYGDISPMGLGKIVASIEAFSGAFVMPIFVVGLSRKYLRI
ncbi:MAG: hypothetical protein COS99_07445 [Candidatus Omnitrophica bacterium CG07_land_8_20_14_0_80_42_15]|uniref:Potassium channel domain-containing protein n=1 Tax=Candidatus Aquitaenariimonas noxiae TaxID=1974741 RepID=A0A2J0KS00_9BACT|nr:MAG: hypothetical protein COS99_07445 [Candidatus Omnitrophica bacterium CG07_land_8_20_14_0_80_42_15]